MHFTDTTEAVRAWVHGWALSRGAAEPDSAPWGFTVHIGLPGHVMSHVLPTADAATVREITGSATGSGVWLKAFVRAESLASWIAPGWTLPGEPGHLMSTPLHPTRALVTPLPDDYRLRTWTRDGVTHARVSGADGTPAARGQTAVTGATAVVDRVRTHPAHRRRGLGRLIMRTLTDAAADRARQSACWPRRRRGGPCTRPRDGSCRPPSPTPCGGRSRRHAAISPAAVRVYACTHDPASSGYAYP
ncbi:GNAT family N-acetyltransferase [Streptomyces sp. NPDC002793]|uniref:GNAT family N-acetyltransferase n=1 Tax=Streptomyces sp. NPDC002793 TaxID=3154432 RepID=UPI0033342BD3